MRCDLCALCGYFHASPGEGACAVMTGYYENNKKISHEVTRRDTKKKNLCNLRNLWFLFFTRLRAKLASWGAAMKISPQITQIFF